MANNFATDWALQVAYHIPKGSSSQPERPILEKNLEGNILLFVWKISAHIQESKCEAH